MSSPEINPELQPPAAKKSRGPLLNNSSSGNVATSTPSGGGGSSAGFYSPVDLAATAAAVPLLKKKPESCVPESRNLMIPILPILSADEDTAYPQSSPSPASSTGFLHPSSPKHITKTETGSLGIMVLLSDLKMQSHVFMALEKGHFALKL